MSSTPAHKPHNIGFVSLGCPKATVDSEHILTQLRAEGYAISPSYDEADLVVINTCGFIDDAIEESLQAIGEALHENGKVIVTGCLGAKGDIVQQNYPNVLAVTGPHATQEVMDAIHQQLPPEHDPFIDLVPAQGIRLTPRHYAYLKISEGCNHRCTFCIIPDLRGDPVKTRMTEMCKALGSLGVWVRLHYVYPYPHVDEIIPLMAEGKLLPYLDIPFQHASPRILKAMKRPAASANTLQRIRAWREICPELTLRSTFIVGFPGETEGDFEQLLDFLDEAQLDRVGCFTYSPVEGARANQLPNPVDEDTKQERLQRFMEKQAAISMQRLKRKIGTEQLVLVDAVGESGVIARSTADAPEIDGLVYIEHYADCRPGEFLKVHIDDTDEHDMWGSIIA